MSSNAALQDEYTNCPNNTQTAPTIHILHLHISSVIIKQLRKATFSFVMSCHREKILSAPSFGGEVKPSVLCRKITACKRTHKWRGSRHFRQNSRPFLAHTSTFRYWSSLASFQTLAVPCGESWNVLITGPPSWGFDVLLATALSKNFLLRRLNDSWAVQNPTRGCSADWRRRRSTWRPTLLFARYWTVTY